MENASRLISALIFVLICLIGSVTPVEARVCTPDSNGLQLRPCLNFAIGYSPFNHLYLGNMAYGRQLNRHHSLGLAVAFLSRKVQPQLSGISLKSNLLSFLVGLEYRYSPCPRLLFEAQAGLVGMVSASFNNLEFSTAYQKKDSNRLFGSIAAAFRIKPEVIVSLRYLGLGEQYLELRDKNRLVGYMRIASLGGFCLQLGVDLPGKKLN